MGGHGLVGHLLPGVVLAWWLLVPHITTVPCTHRHTHTHLHNRHVYFAIFLVPCSAVFLLELVELEMHERCSGLQLVAPYGCSKLLHAYFTGRSCWSYVHQVLSQCIGVCDVSRLACHSLPYQCNRLDTLLESCATKHQPNIGASFDQQDISQSILEDLCLTLHNRACTTLSRISDKSDAPTPDGDICSLPAGSIYIYQQNGAE